MNSVNVVVLIVAIVAIAIAGWALFQRQKTLKLKRQFGPEYNRVIDQEKDARRAETVLGDRQKRVDQYPIRILSQEERERFASKWRAVQEHFVDNPHDAVVQADASITDAMRSRGYPMADFEQRAADLSVDHPTVVQDYRAAHEIAARNTQGATSTEDLRTAMHITGRYSSMCLIPTFFSTTREKTMARELITQEENITTADLLQRSGTANGSATTSDDHEPLFLSSDAEGFRRRWTDIQTGFVDEPKPSVEKADQLVAAVIQKLTQVFADERSKLERDWSTGGEASTEDLRQALRRYRSFFDKLLSV